MKLIIILFLGSYHRFLMQRWLLHSCNSNRCNSITCFCCSVPWGLAVVSQWPCDVCARSSGSSMASGSLCQISGWDSFFLAIHCALSMVHNFLLYCWSLVQRLMPYVASNLKERFIPLIYLFRLHIRWLARTCMPCYCSLCVCQRFCVLACLVAQC